MDILERLRGYNPPDRTNDDHRQIAVDIQDAAAEIERLRAATEWTSTVEIDGIAYPTPPQVAGLLQAVSEERDELLATKEMSVGGSESRWSLQGQENRARRPEKEDKVRCKNCGPDYCEPASRP